MEKYIAGNYDAVTDVEDRVPLDAITEEVQLEVKTHGLCESIILAVPKLWASGEKNLREQILAKGDATATLLTFGYRAALDGFLYERFYQKFLVKRQPRIEVSYTSMRCSVCKAPPITVTS